MLQQAIVVMLLAIVPILQAQTTNGDVNLRRLAEAIKAISADDLEKALSPLVEARRPAPNSPVVLYDFGVTALQMELVLDALPVLQKLHRDHPRRRWLLSSV